MAKDAHRKWNARYRDVAPWMREPSPFLVSQSARLSEHGRALDLAGGAGRNALWLARRGFDVTLVDISDVGLEVARQAAREAGLVLTTIQRDLSAEGAPPGRWQLVLDIHFLDRGLLSQMGSVLEPGGLLLVEQPTRRLLERNPTFPGEYLLEEGELPALLGDLELLEYDEAWNESGRHEARAVARMP